MKNRIKIVAVAAVVSALTVAGLAVAQNDSDESGQSNGGKAKYGERPPGPPPGGGFMIGGPGGKALTYSETHLQKDGKDVTVRADKGKVVSTSDDSIAIERNDGETVEVAVDGDTKVLLGPDKPNASAGDIAAGKQVIVVREDGDDAAEAVLVEPKNRLKLRHRLGGPPPGDMPEPPSFDGEQG